VTVSFEAGTVRIRASGAHAYAAINRAVERIRS
jgi:ribosome-associated translation inhibitor RaiA